MHGSGNLSRGLIHRQRSSDKLLQVWSVVSGDRTRLDRMFSWVRAVRHRAPDAGWSRPPSAGSGGD